MTELYKESYALVAGVSEYAYLSNLHGVLTDVQGVSEALRLHWFQVVEVLNPDKDKTVTVSR